MTVTVLTTTFNRREVLRSCYESLVAQTCSDFEWLVIDDGSTDDTAGALAEWSHESPFPIQTIMKGNGGKHTALNVALSGELRELVLLLDSDDTLAPTAVADLVASARLHTDAIGFVGNRHDAATRRVIGRSLAHSLERTTNRELYDLHGHKGDTFRAYRRDPLQRLRFPEFPGESLVPENVLFDALDEYGTLAVIHGTLYLGGYLPDGYSRRILHHRAHSPRGYAASLESEAFHAQAVMTAIKSTVKYQVWSRAFFGNYGLASFRRRRLYWACLPVARLLSLLKRPRFIFDSHQLQSSRAVTPD